MNFAPASTPPWLEAELRTCSRGLEFHLFAPVLTDLDLGFKALTRCSRRWLIAAGSAGVCTGSCQVVSGGGGAKGVGGVKT